MTWKTAPKRQKVTPAWLLQLMLHGACCEKCQHNLATKKAA